MKFKINFSDIEYGALHWKTFRPLRNGVIYLVRKSRTNTKPNYYHADS